MLTRVDVYMFCVCSCSSIEVLQAIEGADTVSKAAEPSVKAFGICTTASRTAEADTRAMLYTVSSYCLFRLTNAGRPGCQPNVYINIVDVACM